MKENFIKAKLIFKQMDEIVKKDALQILNRIIEILKATEEKDVLEIKNLSNHTIHNASVFQDDCSVSIAVIVYALSKIIERQQYELDYTNIIKIIEKARKSLKNESLSDFKLALRKLFSEISAIDNKLSLYIHEVINDAQVKKGCKLCEHGLSTAKASQVMGVSQWELMNYLGKTKLNENVAGIVDVRTRIKFTRDLFS